MKRLLLILFFFPMIGLGQCISGNCENGYGIYTWESGGKYTGEFKDSKRNGQGTYTYADGDVEKGRFKNNKFIGK